MVNLLTIGDPMAKICIDDGRQTVPKNVDATIAPMDGNVSIPIICTRLMITISRFCPNHGFGMILWSDKPLCL